MVRRSLVASAIALVAVAGFVWADTQRAYLGIMGEQPQAESKETGAVVREVVPEGPADKAGLKAGDRIIQVDDQEIKSFDDLKVRMGAFKPGQKVTMKVVRDGNEQSVDVELGTMPVVEQPKPGQDLAPQGQGLFGPNGQFQFRIPQGAGIPEDIQKQMEEALRNAFEGQQVPTEPTPMIGVQLQPIDEALAKKLQLETATGALVVAVSPDGPADKAGVESEDLIVEADGKAVDSPETLKEIIASKKENDKIAIKIHRGDQTVEKTVEVAMAPAGPPVGVLFRDLSSPQQWNERMGDMKQSFDEMREKLESATQKRVDELQNKLEEGQAASQKALDEAKTRIQNLESQIEQLSKRIEEMAKSAVE